VDEEKGLGMMPQKDQYVNFLAFWVMFCLITILMLKIAQVVL
jgi:hypothetical protein